MSFPPNPRYVKAPILRVVNRKFTRKNIKIVYTPSPQTLIEEHIR